MVEIIPAILTTDIREVEEKIRQAEGHFGHLQIDVLDGQFVPNRTIDPSALADFETNLALDFHLMTKEPVDWVERAFRGGAERVIGQIEMMVSQMDFIGKVQEVGLKVGLALDLDTGIDELEPEILSSLDVVLVMAVPAGFGGQDFDPKALAKIKKLAETKRATAADYKICVDGGINEDNIKEVVASGSDEVVIGRRIFNGSPQQNKERLLKILYG